METPDKNKIGGRKLIQYGVAAGLLILSACSSGDPAARDESAPQTDPKSGVDGDDADALYEHFNQYAE